MSYPIGCYFPIFGLLGKEKPGQIQIHSGLRDNFKPKYIYRGNNSRGRIEQWAQCDRANNQQCIYP